MELNFAIQNHIKFEDETNFNKKPFLDVHCTLNYIETLVPSQHGNFSFNKYLRPVDFCLIFPDNSILLISDREADKILQIFWNKKVLTGQCLLPCSIVNFSYFKDFGDNTPMQIPNEQFRSTSLIKIEKMITAVQLFDGQTMFSSRKEILSDILSSPSQKKIALELVNMRGKSIWIHKSDLEDICM
jgi:hypothetical protein